MYLPVGASFTKAQYTEHIAVIRKLIAGTLASVPESSVLELEYDLYLQILDKIFKTVHRIAANNPSQSQQERSRLQSTLM